MAASEESSDLEVPTELRGLVKLLIEHHQAKRWATFEFDMKAGLPEGYLRLKQTQPINPKAPRS